MSSLTFDISVSRLQVVREEYLEFHASSKDLEEELDTTIKQLDKEKKDFSLMNNRLQEEVDSLKVSCVKHNLLIKQYIINITELFSFQINKIRNTFLFCLFAYFH